ncbi:hypothetical protein ID866_11292 [Astraeus odoratus]|nr:hypothetical protein ID866_11292 [Astraeus odoratus]
MIPAPDFLPLVRTYFVYASISAPFLVDHAPVLLDKLLNVPVVGSIIEAIVRRTFFAQYVGGETVQDALPVIHRLRSEDMGAMMVYSVEVDEKEAAGSEESRRASPHPVRDAPGARPFHKRTVEEIIRGIDAAADFEDHLAAKSVDQGRSTCFAVKLSALLPRAESLRNLSLHLVRTRPIPLEPIPFPGTPSSTDLAVLNRSSRYHGVFPLSEEDIKDLKELYDDLKRICMRAKERRIRVMIDAEHSWYQPAIDAYGHALMQQFNKLPQKEGLVTRWFLASSPKGEEPRPVQPLVYMTYQAYLRRTPAHLAHSLALARRKGYALGVKLVRGAYHPYEIAMHNDQSSHTMSISPDVDPPVYLSKADTDACYNTCASVLVRAIAEDVLSSPPASTQAARLGVLFGTHNWLSSELVLQELVKSGLAREEGGRNGEKGRVVIPPEVADRCSFGQLYGSPSISPSARCVY